MSAIESEYKSLREGYLLSLASALEAHLVGIFGEEPRIDRVSCRVKSVKSFLKKASKVNEDNTTKYVSPFEQIQDIIGARIITFYRPDVSRLTEIVERHFSRIEEKEMSPNSVYEFGYFGKHFVLLLPSDVLRDDMPDNVPQIFELQIKTLFQHAWSEASHDLDYKEENDALTFEDRRKIAFASAQSWGADNAFEEIASNRIENLKS